MWTLPDASRRAGPSASADMLVTGNSQILWRGCRPSWWAAEMCGWSGGRWVYSTKTRWTAQLGQTDRRTDDRRRLLYPAQRPVTHDAGSQRSVTIWGPVHNSTNETNSFDDSTSTNPPPNQTDGDWALKRATVEYSRRINNVWSFREAPKWISVIFEHVHGLVCYSTITKEVSK